MNAFTNKPRSYFDHNAAKGTAQAKPLGDVVEPDFDDTVSMRLGVLVQEESSPLQGCYCEGACEAPKQCPHK